MLFRGCCTRGRYKVLTPRSITAGSLLYAPGYGFLFVVANKKSKEHITYHLTGFKQLITVSYDSFQRMLLKGLIRVICGGMVGIW